MDIYKKQAELLQERMPDTLVRFAMTYGKQKIDETILEMKTAGMTELFVLPMYPQYSETTVAPICDQIAQVYRHSADIPHLKISSSFYERAEYILLLSTYIKKKTGSTKI